MQDEPGRAREWTRSEVEAEGKTVSETLKSLKTKYIGRIPDVERRIGLHRYIEFLKGESIDTTVGEETLVHMGFPVDPRNAVFLVDAE